jgi:1-acyl-sn-glycerol-3-phosphate acyltransferase
MTTDLEIDVEWWDPRLNRRVLSTLRPLIKRYHRAEVRGLQNLPRKGGLLVCNHSGGLFALDAPILATDIYQHFGYDQPLYVLSHDAVVTGPTATFFKRLGFIRASHANTEAALAANALVLVFPGGVYDVYRPTTERNHIDFNGRTGYVKAIAAAGKPIVPVVAIGGQESQLYLTRGTTLARFLRLDKRLRANIVPISFGFPFGLSAVVPPNLPLPTKIVMQVLPPIDVAEQFGDEPDSVAVDEHVRDVMQRALDTLAAERRFPVIG